MTAEVTWTVKALAHRLGVSRQTVARAIRDGRLEAYDLGRPGGRIRLWRIPDHAVRDWLDSTRSR